MAACLQCYTATVAALLLSGMLRMLPICLQVCCGDMVGVLLVAKGKIALNFGQINEKEVSPTEFERLGGRSATKKWKQSIRLIDDNGE
jgi:hypothetical protein